MLKHWPALLIVFGLISLTTAWSADKKAKTTGMGSRREIVNVAVKRPSHVIIKPGSTFTSPTITAAYRSKDGSVTSSFDGKLRSKDLAKGEYFIRLICKTTTRTGKTPKDATTTGDLTVTLTEGCPAVTDTTTVMNVIADNDPDACP
jgi:hypothetical protein